MTFRNGEEEWRTIGLVTAHKPLLPQHAQTQESNRLDNSPEPRTKT
jgi:hypothetical protein